MNRSRTDSHSASILIAHGPTTLALLLVVWTIVSACSEEMIPFNTVEKFRVLSLQAEPPALAEGEATVVSALLFSKEDNLDQVSYEWSWCPIAVNASGGGDCIVSEEMLGESAQQIAEQAVRENADVLPEGTDVSALLDTFQLSYDLGTGPTATFPYAVPSELLLDLCDSLLAEEIPSGVSIPDCHEKLNIVIRLKATLGDASIIAIKNVPLYIDAARADNENPTVGGLSVFDKNGDVPDLSDEMPLLYRGETYTLEADIDASASQTFVPYPTDADSDPLPVREYLFMTWYTGGGETDAARTTFLDGEVPMSTLRTNTWTLPRSVDYPFDEISLFLVLQDERGGTGRLERRFAVGER